MTVHPHWLGRPDGSLLLLHFAGAPAGPWLLQLPAMFEEMNRCRPMAARQARALAAQGWNVVIPDLSGTGDSGGELEQSTVERWLADLTAVVAWIRERSSEAISLWAVRGGALWVGPLCAAASLVPAHLLLWQPVLDGKTYLRQWLRLRSAAAMAEGRSETQATLRAQLDQGEILEVGGYPLTPVLAAGLETATLSLPQGWRVLWADVSGAGEASPVVVQAVSRLSADGVSVELAALAGEPFWSTQETAFAPALLSASQAFLSPASDTPSDFALPELAAEIDTHSAEEVLVFSCDGAQLIGVLHHGAVQASAAVLLVVGGPQYRVGSHRQFLLIARALASAGIPVLRFDYRGMGDADGDPVGFLGCASDLRVAIDVLCARLPTVSAVTVWGLCDAATAAGLYAPRDERVAGLVLVNPWVRSEQGAAQAYLRHYYGQRLLSRDFWRKLLRGQFDAVGSLRSLLQKLRTALGPAATEQDTAAGSAPLQSPLAAANEPLADALGQALAHFNGDVTLILSERDLTAAEFTDAVRTSASWQQLLARANWQRCDLPGADHTFSRAAWRLRVIDATLAACRRAEEP